MPPATPPAEAAGSGIRVSALRALAALWLALGLAIGLADRAAGDAPSPEESATEEITPDDLFGEGLFGEDVETGIAYQFEIVGVGDEESEALLEGISQLVGVGDADIEALLEGVSQLVALAGRPPATLAGLRRRADGDLERFEAALRSEGYYASRLEIEIDEAATPVKVTARVDPGELYLLADYVIAYVGSPEPTGDVPRRLEDLELELGKPARAPEIAAADRQMLRRLSEQGHPLAKIVERKAMVDHAMKSMSVNLQVDAGPLAAFGPVTIVGLERVEEDYVRLILPWKEGQRYDQREVDEARLLLSETQLFQSISFKPAEAVDADGRLPMTVELTEGDRRSIGGGLTFSTDEGPGAGAFWEHRNVFGRNESIRLSTLINALQQRITADLRKPRFLRPDQALIGDAGFRRSDDDALKETTVGASAAFERTFGSKRRASGRKTAVWTTTAGLSGELSQIEDNTSDRNLQIYGLPLSATRDDRDSLLNPARGTRLSLGLTPFLTGGDTSLFFTRAEVNGSAYLSVHPEDLVILAARARLGSIVGRSTQRLPATKRFYSGGGGSVRGFTFRKIGPLDDDNDPLGGRSVLELSGEVRFRVFEDFGLVGFVDSGTVSDEVIVDFEERYLVAAGIGLRYFTGIGPLRFDIAFPINGRDTDDAFQFYVSLGQAF